MRHSLSNSTLFNNYKAVYLVNNKVLLKPGLFSKSNKRTIKAETSSILIISHGTQVIKNVFNNINSPATKDLVLKQVAVIKGFYINIVSKARLRDIGV
jgi:hypothetical protein